ncbi:hypothetical protein [Streptomyces hydrogenans]|uniref:hypothetical protein n=1 Tax=Streptomyces hydrogenans TaxID=1873719 RepID=UPI00406494F0
MTATDVPAILRHRRAWAGLVSALARHPGQVAAAIALLPRLSGYEVEQVVRFWDPDRFTRTEADAPAPPVPQELFDAVLEACLAPLAAFLLHPEPEKGWAAVSDFSTDWSLDLTGHSGGWEMLARCPERWAELAAHPTLGAAVQHLLLDQAGTQALKDTRLRAAGADPDSEEPPADPAPALSEELLLACLPALCLPELSHGRLLSPPEKQDGDYDFDGRILHLAEDLALLSAPPDHLAGACAQLAGLEQPAVVSPAPSRTLVRVIANSDPDHDRPARVLERHNEHRRVQALLIFSLVPWAWRPSCSIRGVLVLRSRGCWGAARRVCGGGGGSGRKAAPTGCVGGRPLVVRPSWTIPRSSGCGPRWSRAPRPMVSRPICEPWSGSAWSSSG